jgi:Flp pilus assembly secretin CpaC
MTATPLQSDFGRKLRRAAAATLIAAAAFGACAAGAAEPIVVTMDQAKVVKMPDKVSTVVVGNPLIADVTIQAGGIMVITGKGYGMTNVVALDRTGNVLMERPVEVGGPRDGVIVVFRGTDRESYNCAPNCEQRVTLGDTQKYFDATIGQTTTRNEKAQGTSAAPAR